ncbi:MAG: aldehyde ferredoxin oxidoreductase family protein [Archaeoglobaceae archaeon]|nr:aldehyde ferredoxin oxidoreductase family protein [Archaeoglobaceae archaeon]MCX8152654.1 aldehyde ferredoxin oxidoreductase family protein [Archaeoglobaceae archaeon]MDW8014064.1 aldehyde ferredoxin oxidoreductase family protein [Archaeoglobaceae archaeon]
MKGYWGKILHVDLSKKDVKEVELKDVDVKMFIGGSGLAAKLLYNSITSDLSPFSPKNQIAFMTGPFTDLVPSGSRYSVASISPHGYWGEASSGGYFGAWLKRTGYDGLIISGKAERPVYLVVSNGKAEIRDASHLWGKDTYETQEIIKKEFDKRARVACIGPAGENLVKFACIINDAGRAAGRTGMGAIIGSKKLKAIAVYGDKKIEIANEDALKATIEAVNIVSSINIIYNLLSRYGTLGYIEIGMLFGDVPARYFTSTVFPAEKVDAITLMEKYKTRKYSCHYCPIGCGKVVEFKKMGVDEVDTPEYETVVALGPLCENYDLETILYANHLCNSLGLDTISMGVCIAFLMYLGKVEWGDSEKMLELIKLTAKREGIGDVLAEGTKGIAAKFGVSDDFAANVKGVEVPMHDARAFFGQALSYATSPRGACHLKPDWYQFEIGAGIAEIGLTPAEVELGIYPGDRFNMDGRISSFIVYQNYRELFDSLLLCKFSPATPSQVLAMFNAITDFNFTMDEFLKAGERIMNLKRMINVKRGISSKDDKLPRIIVDALKAGPTAGKTPKIDEMLIEYYKLRGWNEKGIPKEDKLKELGLIL